MKPSRAASRRFLEAGLARPMMTQLVTMRAMKMPSA
jgi:hypothetical protein